ncbi:MAG: hypothetical protein ACREEZ_14780 [Stellaceae bacterium]
MTEGAAGIAVIVLAVIALAGISAAVLASIATIVIGVGLMVQAFNSAAESAKIAHMGAGADIGGEVMVDSLCGVTGIVLGILALVGIATAHLVPAALIVFGGALLLGGAISMRPRNLPMATPGNEPRIVSFQGSAAAGGMEVLIGIAAIVLGILSLILVGSGVLVLVGLLAVGAALLLVSATFSGAVMRMFTATAT